MKYTFMENFKDKDPELTLILDKLDRLEQQNKLLAQQTQNLQEIHIMKKRQQKAYQLS